MNTKLKICAWSGLVAMTLMFAALWLCWHMLPPISPELTPMDVALHFHDHHTGMLLGGVLMSFAVALLFVFVGGLTACLKKMEGTFSPLTDVFIMLSPFTYFTILLTVIMFLAAAYRPDLDPMTIRLLSDIGLISFVFPTAPGVVMFIASGFIILNDVNPQPIFPRWTGYFSIWVGVLTAPGFACVFFTHGPFAWYGIIAFWLPAVVFGIFINVLWWAMLKAVDHPALTRP